MTDRPDIEAIRARLRCATAGPWEHSRLDMDSFLFNTGEQVSYLYRPDDDADSRVQFKGAGCVSDAVFVAHARTDIPALLDYIEQLEKDQ